MNLRNWETGNNNNVFLKILFALILFASVISAQDYQCAYCGQTIHGKYYESNGKRYHESCFLNHVAKKCDVCGKPLINTKYVVDVFGNQFHEKHKNEFPVCDNCGRLICNGITRGGVRYSDGRNICNICARGSVKGNEGVRKIFRITVNDLKTLGFSVDLTGVKVYAADRNTLKKVAGREYGDALNGYTKALIERTEQGANVSETKRFSIYALDGIPYDYLESVFAHELMHVWIIQNTNFKHNKQLEEGSCNYLSYLLMRKKGGGNCKYIIKNLENDPSPIYGDGFKKVKKKFMYKPLSALLDYLKRNMGF